MCCMASTFSTQIVLSPTYILHHICQALMTGVFWFLWNLHHSSYVLFTLNMIVTRCTKCWHWESLFSFTGLNVSVSLLPVWHQ